MPGVVNHTVSQARSALKSLIEKYDLEIIADAAEQEFNDQVTKGYIIRSEPAEGEPLKQGDTIRLIVSKGPELKEFPMPLCVNQSIDVIRPQLAETYKLVCTDADIEYVESEEEPGTILWQSIEATTMVKEGDTVKLRVSKGLTKNTVNVGIDLPQDDRSTVSVQIYVGDEVEAQYDERVSCAQGSINPPLTGSGIQNFRVLFDGVLDPMQSGSVDFNLS